MRSTWSLTKVAKHQELWEVLGLGHGLCSMYIVLKDKQLPLHLMVWWNYLYGNNITAGKKIISLVLQLLPTGCLVGIISREPFVNANCRNLWEEIFLKGKHFSRNPLSTRGLGGRITKWFMENHLLMLFVLVNLLKVPFEGLVL